MSASCSTTSEVERRQARAIFPLLLALLLVACERAPAEFRFEGPTMGTTYHITVVGAPSGVTRELLQQDIDRVLARVDELMSTWRPDSEISRFNAAPPGAWFEIAPETHAVLAASLDMHRLSAGRFDITVGPLLAAWGFGPRAGGPRLPDDEEIASARAGVGSAALELATDPPRVRKSAAREIELSAIAPGFAVDRVADAFAARGVRDFMVEIGGEVRTKGHNHAGVPWRIGIERPDAPPGTPSLAVLPGDAAVSTSGDYRDFFEAGGVRYSHTIDPLTGRPVTHTLASVSVIVADCMRADALATALHVMGPETGMAFAERERLAVYMMVREPDGSFTARSSTAFGPYSEGTP